MPCKTIFLTKHYIYLFLNPLSDSEKVVVPVRRSERLAKREPNPWLAVIDFLTVSGENNEADSNLGIKIKFYEGKGRGVEATKTFLKGQFVVEYAGILVEGNKAVRAIDGKYDSDTKPVGSYMFWFKHQDKNFW